MPVDTALRALFQPLRLEPLEPKPLVTVLMSTFNQRRFLPAAIESILQQSYSNWELVICDDGSWDDSWTILEKFASTDHRIRTIRKLNGGQASGFNAAYALSSGK